MGVVCLAISNQGRKEGKYLGFVNSLSQVFGTYVPYNYITYYAHAAGPVNGSRPH
jgi:hypothetical protein